MSERKLLTGPEMGQIAERFAQSEGISLEEAYEILSKLPVAAIKFLKKLQDGMAEIEADEVNEKKGN